MDKELALIIAEMLIKQDKTTEQVKVVAEQAKETNSILKDFMSVFIKQWEQQQIFNEVIVTQLKEIKEGLSTLSQLDTRLKAIEERENKFENRLANIELRLKSS